MTKIELLTREGLEQGPFFSENHIAISQLYEYKHLYLPEPKKNWDLEEMRIRSYEIWGIDELIWRLMTNSFISFRDILHSFMDEIMDAINRDGSCTDIFQSVLDTLEEFQYWVNWL